VSGLCAALVRRAYEAALRDRRVDLTKHHYDTRAARSYVSGVVAAMGWHLRWYGAGALLAAAPLLLITPYLTVWPLRVLCAAAACTLIAVPVSAIAVTGAWSIAFFAGSPRRGPQRLTRADVDRLIARAGVATWWLGLAVGLVAGVAVSRIQP
jgi:hypothetical protein